MANYAAYVEEGLLKNIDSPFDEIVEQSIIGSDRFVDWVKREYLLKRSVNCKEEPARVHLQQSFFFEDVIQHVAKYFGVDRDSILTRKLHSLGWTQFYFYKLNYFNILCRLNSN